MSLYAKPTIEKKILGNIIIHCGTIDISKDVDQEKMAADVMNLSK